jgi:hypothetical protein
MPMDAADIAQDIVESFTESSLSKRKTLVLPFSGECLSCGEPVQDRRFCGPDCREAHETLLRRRMIDPAFGR